MVRTTPAVVAVVVELGVRMWWTGLFVGAEVEVEWWTSGCGQGGVGMPCRGAKGDADASVWGTRVHALNKRRVNVERQTS